MTLDPSFALTFPQQALYDKRFANTGYDERSNVRVLTAERRALWDAICRVLMEGSRGSSLTLLDVGCGTGRVTDQLLEDYAELAKSGATVDGRKLPDLPNLEVYALDISEIGLYKAESNLLASGMAELGDREAKRDQQGLKVFSRLQKTVDKRSLTVNLILGDEQLPPGDVSSQLLEIMQTPVSIATSWYSFLGHIPLRKIRQQYFELFDAVTLCDGEILLAVSSCGDLREERAAVEAGLAVHDRTSEMFETSQDLTYLTELGQLNFWHVFGTDLADHIATITLPDRQHCWIEAIRFPDEEFAGLNQEKANFKRVSELNGKKRGRQWDFADYESCHTVAARRSALPAASSGALSWMPDQLSD